jgi:hypothetical protein
METALGGKSGDESRLGDSNPEVTGCDFVIRRQSLRDAIGSPGEASSTEIGTEKSACGSSFRLGGAARKYTHILSLFPYVAFLRGLGFREKHLSGRWRYAIEDTRPRCAPHRICTSRWAINS